MSSLDLVNPIKAAYLAAYFIKCLRVDWWGGCLLLFRTLSFLKLKPFAFFMYIWARIMIFFHQIIRFPYHFLIKLLIVSFFFVNVTVSAISLVFLQHRVLINCLCVCWTILHNVLHGLLVWWIQQEIDLLKVSLDIFFIMQRLPHLDLIRLLDP